MGRFEYLQRIKYYVLFSAMLFLLAFYNGYLYAEYYPKETESVLGNLKQTFGSVSESGALYIFAYIFSRNVFVMTMTILLGIFAGLVPLLSVVSNGMLLGVVGYVISQNYSWTVFLSGILPHGILELPVLILSAAIGLRLGKLSIEKVIFYFLDRPFKQSFKEEMYYAFKLFVTILIPLLFVAALIETFITPELLPTQSLT